MSNQNFQISDHVFITLSYPGNLDQFLIIKHFQPVNNIYFYQAGYSAPVERIREYVAASHLAVEGVRLSPQQPVPQQIISQLKAQFPDLPLLFYLSGGNQQINLQLINICQSLQIPIIYYDSLAQGFRDYQTQELLQEFSLEFTLEDYLNAYGIKVFSTLTPDWQWAESAEKVGDYLVKHYTHLRGLINRLFSVGYKSKSANTPITLKGINIQQTEINFLNMLKNRQLILEHKFENSQLEIKTEHTQLWDYLQNSWFDLYIFTQLRKRSFSSLWFNLHFDTYVRKDFPFTLQEFQLPAIALHSRQPIVFLTERVRKNLRPSQIAASILTLSVFTRNLNCVGAYFSPKKVSHSLDNEARAHNIRCFTPHDWDNFDQWLEQLTQQPIW